MEEEEKKLRNFDIITVPIVDSPIKTEMLDKLNAYIDDGYIIINSYNGIENNQPYISYVLVNNTVGCNGQVRMQNSSASISSDYYAPKGKEVPFEETMHSHKNNDRNNKRNRVKLDIIYKNNPKKLYLFYCVAIARMQRAIDEKKQIYAIFSNEAIQTIIDNGYNTKIELEKVNELKKSQFDSFADLIIDALLPAYHDINKGLTDDMLKNKEAEWHRLAKEHDAIRNEI